MIVLLIEDNEMIASLLAESLKTEPMLIQFKRTATLKEGLDILEKEDIGYIILDLMLPDSQGLETAKKILGIPGNIPISVISGADYLESGIREMGLDFMAKTPKNLARLPLQVIKYAMAHINLKRRPSSWGSLRPEPIEIFGNRRS